jgi:hypothetical protein
VNLARRRGSFCGAARIRIRGIAWVWLAGRSRIAGAIHLVGSLSRLAQRRNKNGDQDRDDPDNHQKLDQSKALVCPAQTIHHGPSFPVQGGGSVEAVREDCASSGMGRD